MGNSGLPRRVESSLSLEGFTLKLEALVTSRGLGKGVQDVNVVVLYLILPPMLRLQDFDPPACSALSDGAGKLPKLWFCWEALSCPGTGGEAGALLEG